MSIFTSSTQALAAIALVSTSVTTLARPEAVLSRGLVQGGAARASTVAQQTASAPLTSREAIESRVRKLIAQQLGLPEDDIKSESRFVADLGADSLDLVEIVLAVEDEFMFEIRDEDAEKITTVRMANSYIERRLEDR